MRIRGQEAARALELPWGTQAGNSRERAESPARVRNTCTTHDASQWENRSSRSGLRGRRGWMVGAKTPRVRAGCAGGRARERSRTRRGASSQMGNSAPPTRESRFGRLGSLARPAPAHTPLVPPSARQGLHVTKRARRDAVPRPHNRVQVLCGGREGRRSRAAHLHETVRWRRSRERASTCDAQNASTYSQSSRYTAVSVHVGCSLALYIGYCLGGSSPTTSSRNASCAASDTSNCGWPGYTTK
jgi:hypothetical protein